eukprot:535695-Alexandrium_andersonii.AAC.1
MLEELAKDQKSTHGNGPASAENDPLPDFDRWREYLGQEHVQSIEPPPGSDLPDQDGRRNVQSRQDARAKKREDKLA